MRTDTLKLLEEINNSLDLLKEKNKRDNLEQKLSDLNTKIEDPKLWDDQIAATAIMKERQSIIERMETFERLQSSIEDNTELIELGEEEGDEEIVLEAEKSISDLHEEIEKIVVEALLDDEADKNDAFLEIKAGAGGTESCDWAQMLSRMYERWAQSRGFKIELISQNRDAEAGLRSITFKIKGMNAYGWLKSESGVHRLVRISPFDSASRRHTSFSSVGAFPVIDENIEIEINPSDLRVDTYRASGAGGQHVNKTDSAVRMTHLPTGIVVTSSEKSQHMNRANCMDALRSRLYELELRKRNEKQQELHQNKGEAGWGNQIRSYVLTPYQMVKDLRTNFESPNPQAVLDGDLDGFMASVLAHNAAGRSR
ncbi:MAG: peptide chain release factor 2 [Paracoccaceae bacterium]|nr:peptide chain release factor 2 [Paracoccaceae bacterium]MDE2674777.1 peptide chain release factor 2 [Paracoccaceae bacterium]MDE2738174.1 peptide chain release factor 2 [Paracoccaceae bacterium]MYF47199.1 peptide chain release factor 2 [Paracoccaceae bacterium]MYI91195.1 peptide chain release factor 2 [Paracoccaceae bacterium]